MPAAKPNIWLYWPNVVGYVRLIVTALNFHFFYDANPEYFVYLFCFSTFLDYVDGALAKMLNQKSTFGAFLDVLVDNLTRGALWTRACPKYGSLFMGLEWLTCASTHSALGHWKSEHKGMPNIVKLVCF